MFPIFSANIFSSKCLMDSMIAMPESSCTLHRYSVRYTARQFCYMEVSTSQFEKTPVKVLLGLVLSNSHVFTEFDDGEESPKRAFLH